MTATTCRSCRAGYRQALAFDIGWRCVEHGQQRLSDYIRDADQQRVMTLLRAALERGYTPDELRSWLQGAIDFSETATEQTKAAP